MFADKALLGNLTVTTYKHVSWHNQMCLSKETLH